MYYGSGIVAHKTSQRRHTRSADYCCICSSERRADVMAAILKTWRHIKNPTQSVNAYLVEEQRCQISSRSNLKRRRLGAFCRRASPNNNKKNNKKIILDQFLIQTSRAIWWCLSDYHFLSKIIIHHCLIILWTVHFICKGSGCLRGINVLVWNFVWSWNL